MNDFDVIVVGGSVSGSMCARLLGEKGLRVLLVDQATFPHPRGGHDLILGRDLSFLEGVLGARLEKKGPFPLTGLSLGGDSGESPIPSSFNGAGVSRTVLDALLFEHASKVVDFREKTQAVGLVRQAGAVSGVRVANLSTKETKDVSADVVVGADGPFSRVAEWAGLGAGNPSHAWVSIQSRVEHLDSPDSVVRIHPLLAHSPAYAWVIPQSPSSISAGLSYPLSRVRAQHLDLSHELESFLAGPSITASAPHSPFIESSACINPFFPARSADNVLLIGHASGAGGSFLGESFSNELHSSRLAADAIVHASETAFDPRILSEYSQNCSKELDVNIQNSHRILRWIGHPSILRRGIHEEHHPAKGRPSFSGIWHRADTRKEWANPIQFLRMAAGI